jgi:hypothetical protein
MYGRPSSLQDRSDTRRLADHIEARVMLPEISPDHKAFIESRGERYMFYQFYLLDQDEHIEAAETFCATDDVGHRK